MSASKIQIKKICEFCGKEFIAYRTSTRFCSKACTGKSYKLHIRLQQVQEKETEIQINPFNDVRDKEFLSPQEVGKLIGITTRSVYNLIYNGTLKAAHMSSRMTFIKRSDIEIMFDSNPYQKRHKKEQVPITEFYTTTEVEAQFGVCASWVFKVGKEEHIPKVFQRGKTLWSKKHFDAYFAKKASDETITEWFSVEDIKSQFDMTTNAVYTFVSKFSIPKKKVKREVFYSKKHVEWAKGITQPEEPQYYTVKEAMQKYNLTRDQLYHYVKRHRIPKVQEGKYVKISRKELDALLAPPVL